MKASGKPTRDLRKAGKRTLAAVLLAILLAAGAMAATARTRSSVVVRAGNSWSRIPLEAPLDDFS